MNTDALGRRVPTRVGWQLLLEAIPGLARQFRSVPREYWRGDRHLAHVTCPCGGQPMVPANQATGCKCLRTYLYTGLELWAANPLKDDAGAADSPAGFSAGRS